MRREPFEFYCSECRGWFIVHLNVAIRGDYIIVCPNCNHEHPRIIRNGEMLEEATHEGCFTDPDKNRYKSKKRSVCRGREIEHSKRERIIPLKSAYSKQSRLHQLEKVRGGFLAELWMNTASGE